MPPGARGAGCGSSGGGPGGGGRAGVGGAPGRPVPGDHGVSGGVVAARHRARRRGRSVSGRGGRDPAGGGAGGGGDRGGVGCLLPVRARSGGGCRRAVLPAADVVGAGAGGSAAGVEGAAGRSDDHPPLGRGGRFRGPAGAIAGRRNRLPVSLSGLVTRALNLFDPEVAEGLEEAALAHREVVFDYTGTESIATARLTATLDALDARDLDAAVSDLAASMGRLGDSSPVGVRRAHALGLLAQPQRVLELFGTSADAAAPVTDEPLVARGWNATRATLYLHVTTDDLRAAAAGEANLGANVERLGAGTLQLLADWLRRTDRLTVRPVLDPSRISPVDRHDPPGRCARPSSSATGTASSPAAASTPGPATSTTSTPTSHPTTADHPAKPTRQPRLPLPATPPPQDLHRLALRAGGALRRGPGRSSLRRLRLDQSARRHLSGQPQLPALTRAVRGCESGQGSDPPQSRRQLC